MANPSIPYVLDLPNIPQIPQADNPELWNELNKVYRAIRTVATNGASFPAFTANGDVLTLFGGVPAWKTPSSGGGVTLGQVEALLLLPLTL